MCDSNDADDREKTELMQKVQNDWYNEWIVEMIRNAKPGAIIAVDEVSQPLCAEQRDWGGVNQYYWKTGKDRYGWDIDPISITLANDNIFLPIDTMS